MSKSFFFCFATCLYFLFPLTISAKSQPGIEFKENKGQWDSRILYRAELNNGYMFITRKGISYIFFNHRSFKNFPSNSDTSSLSNARNQPVPTTVDNQINVHAFSLDFTGMNESVEIHASSKHAARYNYFTGNDPSKWASNVPSFGMVTYKDLYPGIDFRIYSSEGYLKYDIVADSGADIRQVRLKYEGVDSIRESYNSLYITTSLGGMIENPPFAYQLKGKDTLDVPCRFHLAGSMVGFDLPKGYDRRLPLVIDPLLVFSTYSGSTMDNWGNTATYDSHGNVYSGGTVWDRLGGTLPVTKGAFQRTFGGIWDIALLKFDSTGKHLLYATYLGGSDTETPLSLIVNHHGELLVLGITGSADFPITSNAYSNTFGGGPAINNALGSYNGSPFAGITYMNGSDFFIAKLSSDGSQLLASTYLGGSDKDGINNDYGLPLSRNYGDEFRGEINVNSKDEVYITSNTSSTDFPIVNGFQKDFGGGDQDAIAAKFNPDLSSLIWSTYLGGAGLDAGYSIKVRDDQYVVIAGGTMSNNFPVTAGVYQHDFKDDVDGFICKLSDTGDSLIASTYLGTNDYDQAYFTDLDKDGNIYAYGQTSGPFPVTDSVYSDANSGQFIVKFSPDLKNLLFSTVIGSGLGHPDISPTAFLVNECGNIFLSGWGGKINHREEASKYIGGYTFLMPVTDDAFQKTTDGSDFYLMVLSKNAGSLLYSTFLGANDLGPGEHVDGGTSRFDKRGIVYHAICACRDNSQFPTTPGVWSNTNNSRNCNNGVFKFDLASLKAAFTTNTPEFDQPGITKGCYPFDVVFLNKSIGGKLFQWDFGDNSGLRVQDDSVYHEYAHAGNYTVSLYALDENTCQQIDIATGRIAVFEPHFTPPSDATICQGDQVQLKAGGADQYSWVPAYGLNNASIAAPVASPDSSVTYTLTMIDKNTCEETDTVNVNVVPSVHIDYQSRLRYSCKELPGIEITNFTENADRYLWDLGDGNTITDKDIIYQYADTGSYKVSYHAYGGTVCSDSSAFKVHISRLFVPNVITPNKDNRNDKLVISTDAPVSIKILNRWGEPVYKSDSYHNDWSANGLPSGVYYYELNVNSDATCNGWIQVLK